MTTTWSQTQGGTVSTRFHPGLVLRLIGIALIGVAGYVFFRPIALWVVSVLRPGSGGASIGDVIFLLIALVVGAALAVPGAMMAFFGATARVEPIPRRVFARHGFAGFGAEKVTDIGDGATVVVRLHVDQRSSSSTSFTRNDHDVASWKVFVEQPGADRVEIGQFARTQVKRARALAAAVAASLAVSVVDTSQAVLERPTEEERLTSEFLERHGVAAPPKGFKVQAIKVVRTLVEALFS